MPHSHHSHSGQFCKHAKGSLEDVVREAIRQGFTTFGLSEHVPRYRGQDLYPEEASADVQCSDLMSTFLSFLDEAHRLRLLYAEQIHLLVGLETEYITEQDFEGLESILRDHPGKIDYLVGSLHHVNEIPIDFDEAAFRRALDGLDPAEDATAMRLLLCMYFDNQFALMERLRPEVIGHFDLCRLYRPQVGFADYPDVWEKVERNVALGVSYGALFEANAAAFRKGWETAYPGRDVLELIIRSGGRLCLSDDSHGPLAVGLNYGRLLKYLRDAGVQEIWYLERVDSDAAGGRNVQARKVLGEWWFHPFWTHPVQLSITSA